MATTDATGATGAIGATGTTRAIGAAPAVDLVHVGPAFLSGHRPKVLAALSRRCVTGQRVHAGD